MGKITIEKFDGRADWLERRRAGIGGSDAAAIVGVNPYSSAYEVWADKLGRLPEKETTEAMRQGTDLEDYVARRFAGETGKRVRRRNGIIHNSDYPFAFANVDRWVIGERAGLECKTTSTLNLGKFKNGEFPANYYLQCMHYLAVTGADRYYLAVLVFGKEFLWFTIERDEEMIADLMEAERIFWDRVKTGTPPPVDGSKATDETLGILNAACVDEDIDLFGMEGDFRRLLSLKSEKKELETEIKTLEQGIKERLGEATAGHAGDFLATWKPQTRRSFQTKAFESAYPDVDLSPFYKESVSRVLRIKEDHNG